MDAEGDGLGASVAQAEGWEAVTTRRLAERVEYSQPVLYSHFKGKEAILVAVAVDGFADLAAKMRVARTSARDPQRALVAVATAYATFADRRPALYDAMFNQAISLPFATPEAPGALHAAFDELRQAVRPIAVDDNENVLTEVLWSGLHGLVTLMRGGRLPREDHKRRLALLLNRFSR